MQKYRFKFYLNAVHAIEIDGVMGQDHPHTWEFGIEAFKSDDSFVMFSEVERGMERLFAAHQGMRMNDVSPFDVLNPTLENVSIYFKKLIERYLLDLQWFLTRVEISETPARSFIIENGKDTDEKELNVNELWFRELEHQIEQYLYSGKEDDSGQTQGEGVSPEEYTDIWADRKSGKVRSMKLIFVILFGVGVIGTLMLLVGKML